MQADSGLIYPLFPAISNIDIKMYCVNKD